MVFSSTVLHCVIVYLKLLFFVFVTVLILLLDFFLSSENTIAASTEYKFASFLSSLLAVKSFSCRC